MKYFTEDCLSNLDDEVGISQYLYDESDSDQPDSEQSDFKEYGSDQSDFD